MLLQSHEEGIFIYACIHQREMGLAKYKNGLRQEEMLNWKWNGKIAN